MSKYVYIVTDSNRTLVSKYEAFQSRIAAESFVSELNRIRLVSGLKLANFNIVRLEIC